MHRQATNDALRRAANQRQENRARRRRRSNGYTQNSGVEGIVRPYVATAQLYVSVGKLWLLVLCYGDLLLRMSRSLDAYAIAFGVPAASAFTKEDGGSHPYCCDVQGSTIFFFNECFLVITTSLFAAVIFDHLRKSNYASLSSLGILQIMHAAQHLVLRLLYHYHLWIQPSRYLSFSF